MLSLIIHNPNMFLAIANLLVAIQAIATTIPSMKSDPAVVALVLQQPRRLCHLFQLVLRQLFLKGSKTKF